MLSRIEIRNFAIIQSLELDWDDNMTVITGETGAGKSIIIDALGVVLGERADSHVIYSNAKQAEVTATFEVTANSAAHRWLHDNDLYEEGECILRRIISKEGRSKNYINGRSTTLSQLKALGETLVDIHGQHAHQTLLKIKEQTNLIDRFGQHYKEKAEVKKAADKIKSIEKLKRQLESEAQNREARKDLLTYQVTELEQANPEQAVLDSLEQAHKQAATSQDRQILANQAMFLLVENENSCISMLEAVIDKSNELSSLDSSMQNTLEILVQSHELLNEAKNDLSGYRDNLDCDEEKLAQLDNQLALFHDLARKHHIEMSQLPDHFLNLQQELAQLQADETALTQISADHHAAITEYHRVAEKLTNVRIKTAKKLSKLITHEIQALAMDGGKVVIQFNPLNQTYTANGNEQLEFMVSANPGQPVQALSKVASGGELSRISLAIAVITAEQQLVPTLIFDEVDVGIGGGTAEVVGRLLHNLGQNRQVISVTHQPQVASCGDNHLVASKTKSKSSTSTQMKKLTIAERKQEIGRMLGGIIISDQTLKHAEEMLKTASL